MCFSKMFVKKDEITFKVKASPLFWRQKAEESKYAAELIWPHAEGRLNKILESTNDPNFDIHQLEPNTFSIFLSLLGFSTECLFKAAIIRDNPSFVSNGVLSSKVRGHNLIELAKLAKINLSHDERIFCEQAQRAMVVESRYPIAKVAESPNTSIEIGSHCKEVFEALFNRIHPAVGQLHASKK